MENLFFGFGLKLRKWSADKEKEQKLENYYDFI